MKPETIYEALTHTSDEYLDSAQLAMEQGKHRMGLRRAWLLAACITLAVAIVVVPIGMMLAPEVPQKEPPEDYPLREFSADEVAGIFNSYIMDSTTKYSTIYVPSSDFLPLKPLNQDEYQLVYEYKSAPKKALNREEFENFVSVCLSAFCDAAEFSVPSYQIEEHQRNNTYEVNLNDILNGFCFIDQTQTANWFAFSPDDNTTQKFQLDGIPVTVDQTKSDEEIIASIKELRKTLFEIFDVNFSDTKIVREYEGFDEYGVQFLRIYFYNMSDHPMNEITARPRSNYISLEFDNNINYSGDIVSPDWLRKVDIRYCQNRTEDNTMTVAKVKTLPLERAEEYLSEGYVFSGHVCKLCESMQAAVDFTDYDYVSLSYFFEGYTMTNKDKPRVALPVYVFYKYIGKAQNGNLTYAYTYVPAIEVSGMEEYFQHRLERYHSQTVTSAPIVTASPSKDDE